MPQASTQAEHEEAQREERAATSSSLGPSLPASPAELESHRCSCSCSLLFIGMAEGGRLPTSSPAPGPFPPMSLSPFPSGRAHPSPWAGCPVQLGHGLGCTQSPPCRDPHSPRGPGLSLVQLPGLPAPEGEAEPRALCGTANRGMAATPQTPQTLPHMQGMGPPSSVCW